MNFSGIEKLVIDEAVSVSNFDLETFREIASQSSDIPSIRFREAAAIDYLNLTGKPKNWYVSGSKYDDVLDFSKNTVRVYLDGGSGDDILKIGASGNISGDSGDDAIFGSAGNNQLNGDVGNDTLIGGEGNDRLDGGAGNDRLNGGAGKDKLIGAAGNDLIFGGDGDDQIYLESGVNTGYGGAGDDYISYSGSEAQLLKGEAGNDTFRIGSASNKVVTVSGEREATSCW
ncbi:hypothetical protein H2O14_10005 [Rhizobium sp. G21]|nr:hypothetical protein [Rhizobium sp. G21]